MNPKEIQTQDLEPWIKKIADWRGKYPACLPEYYSQEDEVNPYVLMEKLSKKVEEDSIIIPDAGGNLTWTMQAFKIRSSQLLFSAFNHSPMGYALPAAIGAQFATPKRQVICIIGDGGMQMNVQELETVAFYKLPIKIFLILTISFFPFRRIFSYISTRIFIKPTTTTCKMIYNSIPRLN